MAFALGLLLVFFGTTTIVFAAMPTRLFRTDFRKARAVAAVLATVGARVLFVLLGLGMAGGGVWIICSS